MLLRRGDEQTAVHLSDAADPRGADRMEHQVGSYRIEVVEPLRKLRVVLEETEGIAVDLTWEGSFDVVQELPHVMRQGSGTTLDAQRFAQVGTWEGIDRDRRRRTSRSRRTAGSAPATGRGASGRVGEAAPAGKPADPPFEGMWWLYVPIRFDEFCVCLIIQETPDGYRTLNDCTRVWKDGRVEQLGWPRVEIRYASGTRMPTGATITCHDARRARTWSLEVTLEARRSPIHVGGGYGGDSDWTHGVWKGAGFTERLTYDMTDPAVDGTGDVRRDRPRRPRGRARTGRRRRRGLGPLRARRARPARPQRLRRLVRSRTLRRGTRMTLDRDALFIGGTWAKPATDAVLEVVSPHSEEVVARVPEGSTADIDAAVAAARQAFDEGPWPRMTPAERIDVVQNFSGLYAARLGEMAERHQHRDGVADLVQQPGAVAGAVDADRGVPGDRAGVPVGVDAAGRARRRRDGAARADRRGRRDPAVERPAVHGDVEADPGAARRLHGRGEAGAGEPARLLPARRAAAWRPACPRASSASSPAGREVGEHLVSHPGVDKVAFTGSTAAGRKIGAICGEQLKRCSLELGGKSAAIVLDDADLPTTLEGLKFIGIMNSGQACVAQTRVLVSRDRHDVVRRLAGRGRRRHEGRRPDGPGDRDRPDGRAASAGARREVHRAGPGGGRPAADRRPRHARRASTAAGTSARPSSPVSTTGCGSPRRRSSARCSSVIPYDDVADAVRIANDSEYGLAGTVWTADVEAGADVARQVRTGTIGVNTYTMDFAAPFGGYKASGVGREFGPEGLAQYTELKSVYLSPRRWCEVRRVRAGPAG